jgi:hypothetical protein
VPYFYCAANQLIIPQIAAKTAALDNISNSTLNSDFN